MESGIEKQKVKSLTPYLLSALTLTLATASCTESKEHTAPAIHPRDSVATMTTWGVNTLISDSGVIKYRIVAEKWEVNQQRNPSRWIFERGLFLEQFDEKFRVQSHIQCDTAYYFDQSKIWELRGRVRMNTTDGMTFTSEELFWDQNEHQIYSHMFSHLITPERELQGTYFRSDEQLTRYTITNSKGSFVKEGMLESKGDTIISAPDTTKAKIRNQAQPAPRTNKQ